MRTLRHHLMAAMGLFAAAAGAADGIGPRAEVWSWPQWQARITVQAAILAPAFLGQTSLAAGAQAAGAAGAARGVLGAALLGDYTLARVGFGQFSATSGVLLGSQAGAPIAGTRAMLGSAAVETGLWAGTGQPSEASGATPYLGLSYSSPLAWRNLSVSADLGIAADRPTGASGVGSALFGLRGADAAFRELRFAPRVQMAVQYRF